MGMARSKRPGSSALFFDATGRYGWTGAGRSIGSLRSVTCNMHRTPFTRHRAEPSASKDQRRSAAEGPIRIRTRLRCVRVAHESAVLGPLGDDAAGQRIPTGQHGRHVALRASILASDSPGVALREPVLLPDTVHRLPS